MNSTFLSVAKAVLQFEVDNSSLQSEIQKIISRNMFWKNIYTKRTAEEETFLNYLTSDASISIVTGHVGSGKSTFIRNFFENTKDCFGLIIDMRKQDAALIKYGETPESVKKAIFGIIKESFLKIIIENFQYAIFKGENYVNYTYNAEFESDETFESVRDHFHSELNARKKFATEVLCRPPFNDAVREFHANLEIPEGLEKDAHKEQLFKLLNEKKTNELINLLDCEHIVSMFFHLGRNGKTFVMAIDNVDRLDLTLIKSILFDSLVDITQSINRNLEFPFSQVGKISIKTVLAIRDENIKRIKIEGAGAKKIRLIPLGENDYNIIDLKLNRNETINETFVFEVLDKRIKLLEQICINQFNDEEILKDLNLFNKVTNSVWIDKSLQVSHSLNIKNLCNESLRLIFDTVIASAIKLTDHLKSKCHNDEVRLLEGIDTQLLRGVIIQNLWEQESTKHLMPILAQSIKKESIDEKCCFYRLLLIYLNNQTSGRYFKDLVTDFQLIFNVNTEELRKYVFHLYQSQAKQGELVTIYQDTAINTILSQNFVEIEKNYENIKDDALIRLNGKGKVFFESIMISIDFYGILCKPNNSPLEIKVLREMGIDEALKYVEGIFNLVKNQTQTHIHIWANSIAPKIESEVKKLPEGSIWKYYQKNFSATESFFMERVCSSHEASIKNYLTNYIYRPERFFISELEIDEIQNERGLNTELTNLVPSDFHDDLLEERFNDLSISKGHQVRRIWNIYKKYKDLGKTLLHERSKY